MRASDIVNQLARLLPTFVPDFTDEVAITSLTSAGTTATAATASAHGLAVGNQVNVVGAQTPITCSVSRLGTVGTLVTDADHDVTENAGFDVQLAGANEAEFNGTFDLLTVPNRRTITFKMADSGATVATGAPILLNGSSPLQSYNGLSTVTAVPSPTSFEYVVPAGLPAAAGSPVARTEPRVTAAVTVDRFDDAYTKQLGGKAWAVVSLGDSVTSKSRGEDTDATSNFQRGTALRTKLVQSVDVYVFFPTSGQIAARDARDRAEELLSPICKCLLLAKFPSLVENDQNFLQLAGHGFQAYNTAYYVHRYAFEALIELGETDAFSPTDDVAFRDISATMDISPGTGVMTAEIDLDDIPL